jgi:hypothetical protein
VNAPTAKTNPQHGKRPVGALISINANCLDFRR